MVTVSILEGEDIAAEDGSTEHLTINTFQGLSAETIASGEGQDTVMGITAMVAAGDLDGIIASGESILLLQRNSGDYFYDLEEQFGENELAMLQRTACCTLRMRTEWSIRWQSTSAA